MLKQIRNRLNGTAMAVLKEDLKNLLASRRTPSRLGFTYFFLGSGRFNSSYTKQAWDELCGLYFNSEKNCLTIDGINFPHAHISRDEDKGSLLYELYDILSLHKDELYNYFRRIAEITQGSEGPYEYGGVMLEHGDIVIDAGANIGMFSALAHKKVKPYGGGHIYAFEPFPDNVDVIAKTAKINGMEQGITIIESALSDVSKKMKLSLDENNIGGNSVVFNRSDTAIEIDAVSLDDFAHENNLTKIDFIKADIEGAERLMLKGARNVLRDFAPKIAICTYHLPDDPQVLRELILDANAKYVIEERWKKMYAHVPTTM